MSFAKCKIFEVWTLGNWNMGTLGNWNMGTLGNWNIWIGVRKGKLKGNVEKGCKIRIHWEKLETGSRGLKMDPAQGFLRQFHPFGADLSVCKNVLEF